MNSINSLNNVGFFNHKLNFFAQTINKKIWAIVVIALACVAACFTIGMYCLRKKETTASAQNQQTTNKIKSCAHPAKITTTTQSPKINTPEPLPPNPIESKVAVKAIPKAKHPKIGTLKPLPPKPIESTVAAEVIPTTEHPKIDTPKLLLSKPIETTDAAEVIPTTEHPKTAEHSKIDTPELLAPKPIQIASPPKTISASFPDKEESKLLLAKQDRFLKALSPFDRQVRMKSATPVSHEEFIAYYAEQVRSITTIEKNTHTNHLNQLFEVLKNYHIDMPDNIRFIRTTCYEEIPGTGAYCRENNIYYSWLSKGLLAHELFHIYSSHHPEMRKKLYALIGYQVCPPIPTPESLLNKRVVNPDAPELDAFITLKVRGETVQAVPIDLYDKNYTGNGKSKFLQGIYHKFAVVESQDNGEFRFKLDGLGEPTLFDFEDAEDLVEQIGENTGYVDSPEEILAENFALLLTGGYAKTPWVIEKMKNCFLES